MLDGVVGRDPGGEAEPFLLGPPQRGEGEVFASDRAPDVDVDAREGGELFVFEEFADVVAGGLIQNETVGAVLGTMVSEEDDGVVEYPFSQGGIGDEELAAESDR